MQSEKRIFDDLAKVLNGVAGTVAGMGREAEASMRERARDWAARAEADALGKRVAVLEAAAGLKAAPAAKAKSAPKKPAAKK
jgi:BMFP domain-containing protein YqiC